MEMDLFETIRGLAGVKKVNIPANFPQPITFLFFLCAALNGNGLQVNAFGTGVTGKYADKLSASTQTRLKLVRDFQAQLATTPIKSYFVAIYANADPLFLFSPPTSIGIVPDLGFCTVTNNHAVFDRLWLWRKFYEEEPWKTIPQRFVAQARERLGGMLPTSCPENVRDDFVQRVLAGFALDGVIIKSELFGQNPVLLGVESPEVEVLQNATFPKQERIPVIQLI